MKRFEEILSILSSVLLGLLVTDFDKVKCSVGQYIYDDSALLKGLASPSCDTPLARAVTFLLIAMFLRNIHGAARYDELAIGHRLPTLERRVVGRVLTFAFSLAALFLGPFLAGHIFAWHPSLTRSLPEFGFSLFLPFVVYALWDLLLFLFADDSRDGNRVNEEVIVRWVKIDAIAFAFGIVVFFWDVDQRLHGAQITKEGIAITFLIVAGFVICADYLWNHRFYFPAAENHRRPS